MKKLSKIKLQNAVKLEDQEMKMIFGGSGGRCGYSISVDGPVICVQSGGGAAGAEHMAGASGWWCCNCAAVSHC